MRQPSSDNKLIFCDICAHPFFGHLFAGTVFFHFIHSFVDAVFEVFVVLTEGNCYNLIAHGLLKNSVGTGFLFVIIAASKNCVYDSSINTFVVYFHVNSCEVGIFANFLHGSCQLFVCRLLEQVGACAVILYCYDFTL